MLQAIHIQKRYGSVQVLNDITLTIHSGELIALLGSSGAGKSTLLHILGTLDNPSEGQLLYHNEDIAHWSEAQKAHFRNERLGFVFQFHHLLEEFSALENVAIPALIKGLSKKQAYEQASEMLEVVGLADRMKHLPSELSGGEQQRVAVARAIINKPQLILADEPTGNLDPTNTENLFQLFQKLNHQYGTAFLIATHNYALKSIAHKVFTLKNGILSDATS